MNWNNFTQPNIHVLRDPKEREEDRKKIEETMANIFSKSDRTYKSTDPRTSKNHNPTKYEENSTKAYHNQIAQNQS